MVFLKENFWIGAKGGLICEKHRRCMGDSVWLFLWCLLRQTQVSESGEGVVNHGHPVSRAQIADETGYPEWQVKKWLDTLRRTEYIRTETHPEGVVIFVQNAKEKRRGVGPSQHRVKPLPGPSQHRGYQLAPTQTNENAPDTLNSVLSIPKSLSYYNNTAAAKSAAVPTFSEVAKQKQIPGSMTEAERDARRRLLLGQAEKLRARA